MAPSSPQRLAGLSRPRRSELLARADAILSAPPVSEFTERHPGRGVIVARIVLPLELARPLNRSRHATGWQMARERSDVLEAVRLQWLAQCVVPRAPLPGRPMVRAIRFSSVQPDSTAAWWKVPVDVLLPSRLRRGRRVEGIGALVDDRASKLETRTWWERVGRSEGFALIEVWTGKAKSETTTPSNR